MSDIEITIKLPEQLVERARAVGIPISDDAEEIFVELLVKQIKQRESAERLKETMEQLHALPAEIKPTPEEIEAEIKAYWSEKSAQK